MHCDSKRAALKGPARPAVPAISLTYDQAGQIHVRGPITGAAYSFADMGAALAINSRDAAALMRSGLFRRA
jgi:hypothetical protein